MSSAERDPGHAEPPIAGATESVRPTTPPVAWYRRAAPFVIAAVLLAFVGSRVDYASFAAALGRLDYVSFVGFTVVWALCLLGADALGNYAAYRLTMPGVRWLDFFLYRGASYLPSMLNHHVGQAYMTYLMSKLAGIPLRRMAGATLVSYASWMGCLLGCVAIALPFSALPLGYVPAILVAGVAYLVVIALKPARLSEISFLAPLFEAGLAGHAIALTARLPHLGVLVVGNWVSFMFFGVDIPASTALVYLPILLVATTLPITPQGFGTRDTLAGLFFARFATDATEPERLGRLAACTTTWGVTGMLVAILIGLVCARIVQRRLTEAQRAAPSVAVTA